MLSKWLVSSAALVAILSLAGCEVEQTEEGSLPDVEVEGGNMPEYDVDTPEVDVGTKEKTITVPDVNVTMPEDDDDVVGNQKSPREPVAAPQN